MNLKFNILMKEKSVATNRIKQKFQLLHETVGKGKDMNKTLGILAANGYLPQALTLYDCSLCPSVYFFFFSQIHTEQKEPNTLFPMSYVIIKFTHTEQIAVSEIGTCIICCKSISAMGLCPPH